MKLYEDNKKKKKQKKRTKRRNEEKKVNDITKQLIKKHKSEIIIYQ